MRQDRPSRRAHDRHASKPRARLDAFAFVETAERRLSEMTWEAAIDADATRVLLTLNRVTDVITYDLESSVHRPEGGTWASFRVMYVLWLAGPMSIAEIARAINASRAATSALISTLEQRRLVSRSPSATDRRTAIIALTPAGVSDTRRLYVLQNDRERAWTSALSPEEQNLLIGLLGKLAEKRLARGMKARD